ncbi:cytochrome c biogenesis CcdA family protein [Schaalia vaccimaxillae]|uniref:cytochrome c biogenesis CcdA family protein n=1 Tax=Schaalia vaccimaxillae TaxID=183916 RepID=UPI0003B413F0|nr:cytochrome c biogenesis CcdA family protein [Schaalia vaccimaxillae]
MTTIAPIAALLGGVLTLFAPCSVMILPAFFAYAFTSRTTLLMRTGVFWLGLVTVLVPLGIGAGFIGSFLHDHMFTLTRIGALLIIVLGVVQVFAIEMPKLRRSSKSTGGDQTDSASPAAVYLLGATYGFAGVGCAGPVLGAVLLAAGIGGSAVEGLVMMLLYATGMTVPLFVLALIWQSTQASERAWLRPRPVRFLGRDTTWTNVVSGTLFIVIGLVLAFVGPSNPLGALVGTETLIAWEQKALELGTYLPWWLVALAAALAVLAMYLMRPRRKD